MFENQLVVLNPKYNVTQKNEEFALINNEEYANVSIDYRLNFLALCGQNGVGKSTFLRMLSGRHSYESDYTLCWIDFKGELACSHAINLKFRNKKVKLEAKVHSYKLSTLCGNSNLDEENNVRRSLLDVYSVNPELFKLHGKPVFDGFHLDRSTRLTELDELEKELSETLGILDGNGFDTFRSLLDKHPTLHVLAFIATDSSFRGIGRMRKRGKDVSYELIYRYLRDKELDLLDKELNELIYEEGIRGDLMEKNPNGVLSPVDPRWIRYEISDYNEIKHKLADISEKFDKWIERRLGNLKESLYKKERINLTLWDNRLMQIVNFSPFQDYGGDLFHLSDLSDGEYSQIQILFNLAAMVMPEHVCWFYYDDIDDYLHPEWKRNIVSRIASTYLEFTDRIAKATKEERYTEKTLTCVIATHSPFILSDLPRHCVLQFIKKADGKTLIKRSDERTFAGNIGELFHTEFFMDSTIGEFSRQEIKKAIKKLENDPSQETIEAVRRLFESVGDDVLRSLLLEKIQNAKN